MLNVRRFPVGPFEANAYLVWDAAPGEALLVDAGAEAERLLEELSTRGLELTAILQTHAHGDHIAALPAIVAATGAPVYVHADAEPMLASAEANLSALAGLPVTARVATTRVAGGDRMAFLGREVRVLDTPGHAPGSVCFHFAEDGVVFTGDALFRGSIGRTDFPGGSFDTLIEGIRSQLLVLPDNTRVFPGHDEATTIGFERRSNPFLRVAPPSAGAR